MPIDSNIADLAHYATELQKLKHVRDERKDGVRPPEANDAAQKQLAQLRALRDQIKAKNPEVRLDRDGERELQERGVFLQAELNDLLINTPSEYLAKKSEFEQKLGMTKMEAQIFETVARESQKRHRLLEGVKARFLRQARKQLGRQADDEEIDGDLQVEVGRLIFKAKTLRAPKSDVYWQPSNLALVIETTDIRDVARLDGRLPGGHYNEAAVIRTGLLWLRLLPFIFIRKHPFLTSQLHEEGHAENEVIVKSLGRVSGKLRSLFFGEEIIENSIREQTPLSRRENANNRLASISKASNKNGDLVTAANQIEAALRRGSWQDSLMHAKDEVLADFKADRDFTHLQFLLKKDIHAPLPDQTEGGIRRRGGAPYQYLERSGLNKYTFADTPELHDEVANRYNAELSTNVKYMEQVWGCFKEEPDASKRFFDLIAFMRQNPLQEWRVRGENYFGPEYAVLSAKQAQKKREKQFVADRATLLDRSKKDLLELEVSMMNHPAIRVLDKYKIDLPEVTKLRQEVSVQLQVIEELQKDEESPESLKSVGDKLTTVQKELIDKLAAIIDQANEKTRELEKTHSVVKFIENAEALHSILGIGSRDVNTAATGVIEAIHTQIKTHFDPPLSPEQGESLFDLLQRMKFGMSTLKEADVTKIFGYLQSYQTAARAQILKDQIQEYAPVLSQISAVLDKSTAAYEKGAEIREASRELIRQKSTAVDAAKDQNELAVLDTVLSSMSPEKRLLFEGLDERIRTQQKQNEEYLQTLANLQMTFAAV